MTTTVNYAGQLRHASVTLGNKSILHDIDLTISPKEIVSLIGRSGSGKTTTLRVFAELTVLTSGQVHLNGATSVAFQQPRLFPWRKVIDNISDGLTRSSLSKKEILSRSQELLAEVELSDKADVFPNALSGGQAQRVSLARALAAQPSLLLLDEPFSALDALTREVMHKLLLKLWEKHGFGILLVTHDIDEAIVLSDRVLVLINGRIAHDIAIDQPREISQGDKQFADYRNQLLDLLGLK